MTEKTELMKKMKADTTLWICDVDYWNDEVDDCQLLLEKNLAQIDELEERKRLEQFQNQIIYYRDELLPELKHDLVQHQKVLESNTPLEKLVKSNEELNMRQMAIHEQMKERRRQLNLFINNI